MNITNVTASNATLGNVAGSCFRAIVAQGPVAFDYNGPTPVTSVPAITGVTISNCDSPPLADTPFAESQMGLGL